MTVTVLSQDTSRRLSAMSVLLENAQPLLRRGQVALRRGLQRHFADRDKEGNWLGGRRSHFWRQIRTSTVNGAVTATTADVIIGDSRFRQKLHGGQIFPKKAKYLTIPVDPLAYGLRAGGERGGFLGDTPGEFERVTGLELIFIRQNDHALLVTIQEGSKALHVRYLLVRSVNQQPDPRALPEPGVLDAEVVEAAHNYVQSTLDKQSK